MRGCLVQFLNWLGDDAVAERLPHLSVEEIQTFFIKYSECHSVVRRRSMRSALRTFFRFCQFQGYIMRALDAAVPTLQCYKLAHIPRGLTEEQAQIVLSTIDRETNCGRRDYAILQLLYTYGVRAGQVRALEFKDIDWRQSQISFRASKWGKDLILPLAQDVGESLLSYIRDARPAYSYSEIFLTARAPYHPFRDSHIISKIARERMLDAGIEMPKSAAHAFRHCFATRMFAQGHSLKAIGDLLGHRNLQNTRIYTKVDFQNLEEASIDWPEET
jgi:integrase